MIRSDSNKILIERVMREKESSSFCFYLTFEFFGEKGCD